MEVDRIHSFSRCELSVMDEVKSGGPGVYRGLRYVLQYKPFALARNTIYYFLPQSIFRLFNLLVTMGQSCTLFSKSHTDRLTIVGYYAKQRQN